jgi:hypothetical protein
MMIERTQKKKRVIAHVISRLKWLVFFLPIIIKYIPTIKLGKIPAKKIDHFISK